MCVIVPSPACWRKGGDVMDRIYGWVILGLLVAALGAVLWIRQSLELAYWWQPYGF